MDQQLEIPCLACRNYSAIDTFAIKYNLPNVSVLITEYGSAYLLHGPHFEIVSVKALYAVYKMAKEQNTVDLEKHTALVMLSYEDQEEVSEEYKEAEKEWLTAIATDIKQQSKATPNDASGVQKQLKQAREKFMEVQKRYCALKEFKQHEKLLDAIRAAEADVSASAALVQLLKGQFQRLLDWIAITLWQTAVSQGILDPNDHVGRARLFFTWTATSIVYDSSIKGQNDREEFREIYDSLGTGLEVCRGFAELFQAMFDAVTDAFYENYNWSQQLKAKSISGVSRRDVRHAWNAFPCNGDLSVWKLIDPCWAGGKESHLLHDPSWFVQSNEDFLLTHLPDNVEDQLVVNTFKGTKDDFRNRMLVSNGSCPTIFHINIVSISPQEAILAGSGEQIFEFNLCCAKAPKRQFFIAINSARPSKIAPFICDGIRWRVKFDLTKVPRDGSHTVVIITPVRAFYDLKTNDFYETSEKTKKFRGKKGFYIIAEWNLAKVEGKQWKLFNF